MKRKSLKLTSIIMILLILISIIPQTVFAEQNSILDTLNTEIAEMSAEEADKADLLSIEKEIEEPIMDSETVPEEIKSIPEPADPKIPIPEGKVKEEKQEDKNLLPEVESEPEPEIKSEVGKEITIPEEKVESEAVEEEGDSDVVMIIDGKEIRLKAAAPTIGENAAIYQMTPRAARAASSQPASKTLTIGRYSTNGVTYTSLSGTPYDWHAGQAAGYFHCTDNGSPAFCMNSTCLSPLDGLTPKSGTAYKVQNETLRKLAYYGLGGPGYAQAKSGVLNSIFNSLYKPHLGTTISGYVESSGVTLPIISDTYTLMANSLTHESISRYNPYDDKAGDGHGYYKPVGMDQFMAWINNQANAPENFYVWRWAGGSGKQDVLTWEINPTGKATLTKSVANNKSLTDLCPENYSLAGAVYGVYSGSSEVARFTTKADGSANTVELNAGNYTVKEITAPKGYKIDRKTYTVTVTAGQTATLSVADEPIFDPFKVKVHKKAAEGVDQSLSLEGAEYTVKYYKEKVTDTTGLTPFRTWIYKTRKLQGNIYGFNLWEESSKIGGDELFKNENGTVIGLHGTYTVEETKAPAGFAKTEGIISTQVIDSNTQGQTVNVLKDVTNTEKAQTVSIKIQKVDAETGAATPQGYGSFENAEFEIYHFDALKAEDVKIATIKTNASGVAELKELKPGKYTVKEIKAPAGYLLNSEDQVVLARIKEINTANFEYIAEVKEKPITVEIAKTGLTEHGVSEMVSGAELQLINSEGQIVETWITDGQPKTFKGLAAGNYTVKETKVPDGYLAPTEDFTFEVKEIEEVQKVEIFNEPVPTLKTEAFFEGEVKNTLPKKEVKLFDKVSYDKLIIGKEYTLKGKLVDADDPNTVIATGETTFIAEASEGSVLVEFTFNASELEGKTMVVFEDIYKDGRLLATHAEITDEDQTVTVPKVRTTATDKTDGDKDLLAGKKQTIVDVVSYKKLTVGKEYTVMGTLMIKSTGKPLTVDGKPVTAEKTFTAETPDGEISLEFTFDASAAKGETIVVFEKLYNKNIEVAAHADIEDKEQSVYVPKAKTTASVNGKKQIEPAKEITVTDKVSYTNLIIGKTYTVKGILMDKHTGKPFLINGKEITAEKSFTAAKADGEITLEFTFDGSNLKNEDIVVFEKLYRDEKLIAAHEDIEDEDQSIKVLKIGEIRITDKPNLRVNTGDDFNVSMYFGVAALASLSALLLTIKRRKKDRN